MATSKKPVLYITLIAVLLLVIAGMAYKFIVAGSTVAGADGRAAIVLEPGERALILGEMRGFLSGIQTMTDALTREDMKTVAKTARSLGRAASAEVPPALMGKLPLEFKKLGFSVHSDFDQMAMDAESLGDAKHTLTQLSGTLQKCVACHATFQLQAAAAGK